MKQITIIGLLLSVTLTGCNGTGGESSTSRDELRQYQQGVDLYEQEKYLEAISQFQGLIRDYADGKYADDGELYIGRSHYNLGELDQALADLDTLERDYPKGDTLDGAAYWRGVIYVAKSDTATALKHFQRVIDQFPKSDWRDDSYYGIADIHYGEKKYQLALDNYNIILEQFPDSIRADNAQFFTGRCHQELAQFDLALADYAKVGKNYPKSTWVDDALYYTGKTYMDMNQYGNAITTFNEVLKNHADTNSADGAQYFIGKVYQIQALYAEARAAYDALIANYPDSNWVDNAKYQKASTYYDAGDFTGAVSQFTSFINNNPGSSLLDAATYYIGRSYHQQTPPNYAQARTYYGTIDALSSYYDNSRYYTARTHYDNAVDELANGTPNNTTAVQSLGAAIELFDTFLANTSLSTSNYGDNVLYYRGRSYQRIAEIISAPNSVAGNIPGTNPAIAYNNVDFNMARAAFDLLTGNTTLTTSSYMDDALYQTGYTYYFDFVTNGKKTDANLNGAAAAFRKVYPAYASSNAADNAVYRIGMVHHLAAETPISTVVDGSDLCSVHQLTEREFFTKLIDSYPNSLYVTNAKGHLANPLAKGSDGFYLLDATKHVTTCP